MPGGYRAAAAALVLLHCLALSTAPFGTHAQPLGGGGDDGSSNGDHGASYDVQSLWAGAQEDLREGRHQGCADKFQRLHSVFTAAPGADAELQTLATQTLVNVGVCFQAMATLEGQRQAANAYRRAIARSPGFAGAATRLCTLLRAVPALEAAPGEQVRACLGGLGAADALAAANAEAATDACGQLFVSPGDSERADHVNQEPVFMQPRYAAWWLGAGLLRHPDDVDAAAQRLGPVAQAALRVGRTTKHYYAQLFRAAARRALLTAEEGIAVLQQAATLDRQALDKDKGHASNGDVLAVQVSPDGAVADADADTARAAALSLRCLDRAVQAVTVWVGRMMDAHAVHQATLAASIILPASLEVLPRRAALLQTVFRGGGGAQTVTTDAAGLAAAVAAADVDGGGTDVIDHALTVSVVVPCRNCAAGLRKTLAAIGASLLHLVLPENIPLPGGPKAVPFSCAVLEVVVVDDASSDDSAAVAQAALRDMQRRFDDHVGGTGRPGGAAVAVPVVLTTKVVRNAANLGAGGSRNAGVNATRGDVLFFCDSEDLWHVGHAATCLGALMRSPFNAMAITPAATDMRAMAKPGAHGSGGGEATEEEHKEKHEEEYEEEYGEEYDEEHGGGGEPGETERGRLPTPPGSGSWHVHPSWQRLISNAIPSNKCVQRWAHDFVQGFPVDDPVFRHDGEDQAYLDAIKTFFQVHVPSDTDPPMVDYVYQPGHNLDQRRAHFERPRAEYEPTPQDTAVRAAISKWVDGKAVARGVLSELHDLLLLPHEPTTPPRPLPPPPPRLRDAEDKGGAHPGRGCTRHCAPSEPVGATEAGTPSEHEPWPREEDGLSWLQGVSARLNPGVHAAVPAARARRVDPADCAARPLFTFETLGFLHNQLVSLNNAVRLTEWDNLTLVLPGRIESVLAVYVSLDSLMQQYCVLRRSDAAARRGIRAGNVRTFSSEEVFFLNDNARDALAAAAAVATVGAPASPPPQVPSPLATMGRALGRQAPLRASAFHDDHFGRVLAAVFAEPLLPVRAAVEQFLFGHGGSADPSASTTTWLQRCRGEGEGASFAAVHLRWSEATCSLRMHRDHHHPAVPPPLRGLGPCFMRPEYVARSIDGVLQMQQQRSPQPAAAGRGRGAQAARVRPAGSVCELPLPVFLGSDGQRPDREAELRRAGLVQLDTAVATFFPDGDELGLGPVVVDFLVMSLSAVFLGNPVSTFSINVASLRTELGHAYNTSVLYEAVGV